MLSDRTKNITKPTLEKNDNIDKIKDELKKKIESIQRVFDSAWEKSPLEHQFSQICYFTSNAGAEASKDTQIQSLLERFKSYERVQQIKNDFWNLKAYCSKQCETNKVSQLFGDSYLINLHLMEVLFTCAFIDNVSYVMESTPITDPVPSVETESKVDFEGIVEQVKNSYEADLHDQLFADQSKALISELLPAVVDLNSQIDLYHENRKKVFEIKPLSAKDEFPDVPKPIKQLLSDELAYASLCILDDIPKLKRTQQGLIDARQDLLVKHNKRIDEFLTTIRAKVVPAQINCEAISELAPLVTKLHQAEAAISSINEHNRLRLLKSNGILRLKEILIANKELKSHSLQEVVDDKRPGLLSRNRESMTALWKEYDTVLRDLAPQVKKIEDFTIPTRMPVTTWTEKRNSIAEKLKVMKDNVIEIVNNKISSAEFLRKKEDIIRGEGDNLRQKTCSDKEILPVGEKERLVQRRVELDKQWEVLLTSKDNIEILTRFPGKLYKATEKLDQKCVKRDVYIATALSFRNKLAPYQTSTKKTTASIGMDAEEKASSQVAKSALPVVGASAQELQFVGEEAKLNPVSVQLYGSIQFEDKRQSNFKPKRHWYTKFVDEPWKRALLIGLGVFVVGALAATGVGLLLETTLTVLLGVALGGGAGAGLLTGGVTYACSSHGYERPRQIPEVKPENVTKRSELRDKRRAIMLTASAPSVFPVYAPNVLNDSESTSCFDWFLRRRKEHRVEPLRQANAIQPKGSK